MAPDEPLDPADEALIERESLRLQVERLQATLASMEGNLTDVSEAKAELERRYRGMLAREVRYRREIASLTATSRKSGPLFGGRLGRAARNPRRALKHLAGRFGIPADRLRVIATSSVAGQLSRPAPPRKPLAELQQEALQRPDDRELQLEYASRLFLERGSITDAEAVYEAALSADSSKLSKSQALALRRIQGIRGLQARLEHLVPPHQPNPNYVAARGSILYCAHQALPYASNGYATRTHGLAAALSQMHDLDVTVLARPGYPWDDPKVESRVEGRHALDREGVKYVFVPGANLQEHRLDHYVIAAADTISREATRVRAEIIHSASNHVLGLAALIAARRLGVPFVYEVRGLWEVTRASVEQAWAGSDHHQFQSTMEAFVASRADRVLAITEEVKADLCRRGVDEALVDIAPNAVDTELFAPIGKDERLAVQLGISDDVPVIGFAGSLVMYEGLELLIEAMAQLKASGAKFRGLIVGDGKSLPTVQQRVNDLGLKDVVHFTGRVPAEDVPRYLSLMDVLPIPRHSLPVTELVSPLKPLEAMAMGKVVVLSDVAPHLVFAGGGERALLFRKDDVGQLAAVLERALMDRELRSRVGARARAWVTNHRQWQHTALVLDRAHSDLRQALRDRHASAITGWERPKVALIADRFTSDSLSPDLDLIRLSPAQWEEQLSSNVPVALLVESAWEGNGAAWHRKVGWYSEEEIADLKAVVEWCRDRNIPTLFWNKEDPVHFNRFRATAAMFDYVFTTDANKISDYLATPGAVTRVASSLPFYAQPKIHNPLVWQGPRDSAVCYGGTYYGDRYRDRTKTLDLLLKAAAPHGLAIYDRQHLDPSSPYRFPAAYEEYVRGGLDYHQMIEAYGKHQIHLNVNSVTESPTMFSRRVMEIVACGSAVLSGPGEGVEEVFDGAVPTVDSEEDAGRILQQWADPISRMDAVWPAYRCVLRAHTARHRIVQMLRTAGIRIGGPELPSYAVVTEDATEEMRTALSAQTHPPQEIAPADWDLDLRGDSPTILLPKSEEGETAPSVDYLVPLSPSKAREIAPSYFEDLLTATLFTDGKVIGTAPNHNGDGSAVMSLGDVSPDGAVFPAMQAWEELRSGSLAAEVVAGLQVGNAAISGPAQTSMGGVRHGTIETRKRLLVAGHDLKFVREILSGLEARGYVIDIDEWSGHTTHDEEQSRRLLDRADVVLCEWTLGNAVWYGKNRRSDQRLIARLHRQEVSSSLLRRVNLNAFDRVIFVGPHIRDAVIRDYRLDSRRTVVIPNFVNTEALALPKSAEARRTIGMVGITPRLKRFDLALDLLARLRKTNPEFRLRVKGRRPEEYPWMLKRPDELAYYEAQYQRIEREAELTGAVEFDGHGDDMPEWYRHIGYALSVSDLESFHLTIADGAASGAVPIVRPWEGADRIYPPHWVSADLEGMVERVLQLHRDPSQWEAASSQAQDFARRKFAPSTVVDAFEQVLFLDEIDSGHGLDPIDLIRSAGASLG